MPCLSAIVSEIVTLLISTAVTDEDIYCEWIYAAFCRIILTVYIHTYIHCK